MQFVLTASHPWGSLSRICFCVLHCLPSDIYTHFGFPPEPFYTEQPTPFSLSSYETDSNPLIILVTLCCPLSTSSISLWPWESQNSVFLYTFCVSVLAELHLHPHKPPDISVSCSLGWTALELGGQDFWIQISFLGLLSSPGSMVHVCYMVILISSNVYFNVYFIHVYLTQQVHVYIINIILLKHLSSIIFETTLYFFNNSL